MTPPLYDLFGEIPVYQEEIEIWIDIVPGWSRTASASRRANYARNWDVASKIRAAKESGLWCQVEADKADQLASVGITRQTGSRKP